MIVTLPIRTLSEMNMRQCWQARARRVREQRGLARLVVAGTLAHEPVKPPCEVHVTRCAPSGGLDDDNLRSALKAVRDGIADALGIDDGSDAVVWRYDQRRSKPGVWSVEIRIVKAA